MHIQNPSDRTDLVLTALAPLVWGSTYVVTTELLPPDIPLTVSTLRALPAGLVLLVIVRRLPRLAWLGKIAALGALNFAVFWASLFLSAYLLPGGLAATLGAVQPLLVLVLARLALGTAIRAEALLAAGAGLAGVALLVAGPAALNPAGVMAALTGALSMALGTVLMRKWALPVSALTLTAWQLTAGGLLLLPVALWLEPGLPVVDGPALAGFIWLGLVGSALGYLLWFRGVLRLGPERATALGFLSPLSAVVLGWLVLGEAMSPLQALGAGIVLVSVWAGQRVRGAPQIPGMVAKS